ncbi:protein SRG1-like [Durio zibethinus]|uniref:Protein SRG1-like n=1 Tax=Durio zibethinus TaxID=66656 RepID=A0A6P6AI01_DURZI|nr:protein SRG1-like [Durio zibethinus]
MELNVEKESVQRGERLGWGKSFLVPSVQEIVRNDSQSVPERYIQEQKDRPLISENLLASLEIPVIDFSLLAKGDEDEIQKLDLACKEWGFFQIINHGVREEVLNKMKASVAAFFELPLEEKNKYAKAANEIQGYGQNFVVSEDQKLDWSDMIYLITVPPENRNFKFWPLTLPGFKETVEAYSSEVQKVAEEMYGNLSLLMGIDRDGLKKLQGELKQGIRMNYYPVCSRPDLVLGISSHSDGSLFTLLLQDDDITGLQIKHKETWIGVKPIPNSLVVNIGDATEILSNGKYKSIEHRACTNEKKPRMSVATFVFPDDEVEIGPLESMMNGSYLPRLYRNIKYVDYIRQKFRRKMEGKAHTDFVKLESK